MKKVASNSLLLEVICQAVIVTAVNSSILSTDANQQPSTDAVVLSLFTYFFNE